MDLRNYQISFCKTCHNRKMDFKVGLTCKLTGKVADFNLICESFSLDDDKRAIKIHEIEEKITNNRNTRNKKIYQVISSCTDKMEFLVEDKVIARSRLLKGQMDLDATYSFKNTKKKMVNYLVYGIFGILIIYYMIKSSSEPKINLWVYALIILMMTSGVALFFKRFFNKKETICINKHGIELKANRFYSWIEILYCYFETRYDSDNSYDGTFLVFHLSENRKDEIEIGDLEVDKESLGELLYLNLSRISKIIAPNK